MPNKIVTALISALFIFPAISTAENEEQLLIDNLAENTVAFVAEGGVQSAGLSWNVHDVYFDGYSLSVKVKSVPNDEHQRVYSAYFEEESPEDHQEREQYIGSYCDMEVQSNGTTVKTNSIGNVYNSEGGITHNVYWQFDPDNPLDEVDLFVNYGIIESGELIDSVKSIKMNIKKIDPISIKEIHIDETINTCINKILFVSSDKLSSVYLYYNPYGTGSHNPIKIEENYAIQQMGHDYDKSAESDYVSYIFEHSSYAEIPKEINYYDWITSTNVSIAINQ